MSAAAATSRTLSSVDSTTVRTERGACVWIACRTVSSSTPIVNVNFMLPDKC
jgi:hypothetical protein